MQLQEFGVNVLVDSCLPVSQCVISKISKGDGVRPHSQLFSTSVLDVRVSLVPVDQYHCGVCQANPSQTPAGSPNRNEMENPDDFLVRAVGSSPQGTDREDRGRFAVSRLRQAFPEVQQNVPINAQQLNLV